MKYLFVLLFSVLCFVVIPCRTAVAHTSVKSTSKSTSVQKISDTKTFKVWKIHKKRHSNPAPVFLIVALVAAAGAVAAYFLTQLVIVAAVLGAIAFIAFILYFVYSGAN